MFKWFWTIFSLGAPVSSAIWDKAQVNFLKTNNQYGLAIVQFVVFEKFTSADLSQIAREKSSDFLLIIYMLKIWLDFSLLRVSACHRSLFPPTNDNLD